MDTETISAFRVVFIDSLAASVLQDRVAMRFPAKITSSYIWVAIPVGWVILHWCACGADGRSLGQSVYSHVITKFSRVGRLPHFLKHGAPLHALCTWELRYNGGLENTYMYICFLMWPPQFRNGDSNPIDAFWSIWIPLHKLFLTAQVVNLQFPLRVDWRARNSSFKW